LPDGNKKNNYLNILLIIIIMNSCNHDEQINYDYQSTYRVIDKQLYEYYSRKVLSTGSWESLKPIAKQVLAYIKPLKPNKNVENTDIWNLAYSERCERLEKFINGNPITSNDSIIVFNLCFNFSVKEIHFNSFYVDRKDKYLKENIVKAAEMYHVISEIDENDLFDHVIFPYDGFFPDELIADCGLICINHELASKLLENLEKNKKLLSKKEYTSIKDQLHNIINGKQYLLLDNN